MSALLRDVEERLAPYTEIRRRIHSHPELGFRERETSALVVRHLQALGVDVEAGIGETGVVGTIRKGNGRSIGLRADMDALPLQEQNDCTWRSAIDNRFHGCGHDGHTAMLLAAAELLIRSARFDGTVHLIFQPAEEGLGGAQAMIDDGLFERFPCDSIFGMHNMPRLPAAHFAIRSGPFLAAADSFRIVLRGKGGHAAMPHTTVDPVIAAAHIVTSIQTLVSRNTDPLRSAVFSVSRIRAGEANNVIPETVELAGTARFLDREHRQMLSGRFESLVRNVAAGFGVTVETFDYVNTFPLLVNAEEQTRHAISAAVAIAGADHVITNAEPIMGSEDFAVMLEHVPGCYILIGNGGGESACMIHNPNYDFNDRIIPAGARYWTKLVETLLPL